MIKYGIFTNIKYKCNTHIRSIQIGPSIAHGLYGRPPRPRLFNNCSRQLSHVNNKLLQPKKTIISEQTANKTDTKIHQQSELLKPGLGNDSSIDASKKSESTPKLEAQEPKATSESNAISVTTDENGEQTIIIDGEIMSEDDFLTTIFENMEPYMDTYEVYTQLIRTNFTPAQADEIINLLIVQLNSKLSKLSTKYTQSYELENEQYLYESAQQELRVDITRSRESHINELINLINILERDFHTISDELNNYMIQMKNDTQVALSDQKSENTLLSKKIILRIQETNHKITTELNSAMRSEIESLRWHYSRWGVMAILVSIFSAFVSYYIWKGRMARRQTHKDEFVPLVIYEPSELDEDDYHTDLDKTLIN